MLLLLLGGTASAEPPWSVRMADSEMRRTPDPLRLDATDGPKWEYTQGLVLKAILEVGERTGDDRYWQYALGYYDAMIDARGQIRGYRMDEYNIDRVNPGKPLFRLYERTHDEKYRKAIEQLRLQLHEHPRTSEGGFWHKQRYPNQMWLDGLYMGAPFLAQYGKAFGETAAFDDVVKQFVLMERHARDERTGLLYHGWDESRQQKWADPASGHSRSFWGRAIGWYAMGLVEALDSLPARHSGRSTLIAILDRLAAAVTRVQDPASGVWYQVLDQGGRAGNYLEASVSSMLAFALLKGARLGYIDTRYADAGRRAYAGILKEFVEVDRNGLVNLHRVCQVAGLGGDPERERYRDGSYEYYVGEKIRSNDPKAVGPFIFASLEMELTRPSPVSWRRVLDQPLDWYASPEALWIADNVLAYQRSSGGWPKNVELASVLPVFERARVIALRGTADATIDNGATFTQIRYLARVLESTQLPRFREPLLRGIDFLLAAQYPNGGWPQFFPLRHDYSRHVTFNDDAMIGVMRLLGEVEAARPPFAVVDAARRRAASRAVERGVAAILKTQVQVDGRLTAWCAQHDERTFEPRPARSFEPAALSGKESVEIVLYLIEIAEPSREVVRSIEAAVEWLSQVRIEGQRVERVPAPGLPGGEDVIVRPDPAAPPLWARFYQIGSNQPLFVGRDGVSRHCLSEIEHERRVGYGWLGPWAADLLAKHYPAWRARLDPTSSSRATASPSPPQP